MQVLMMEVLTHSDRCARNDLRPRCYVWRGGPTVPEQTNWKKTASNDHWKETFLGWNSATFLVDSGETSLGKKVDDSGATEDAAHDGDERKRSDTNRPPTLELERYRIHFEKQVQNALFR